GVARVVGLRIRLLPPEVGLHDAAAPHADLQAPVAQVVEHADLFDEAQGMMQGQDVHAGPEAEPPRALGHRGEEHILRRSQAVDGGRVVLGEVIRVEAGRVEALDLREPLAIDAVEAEPGYGLDVVEHAEAQDGQLPASAAFTRSGRKGTVRSRPPVASNTALASAAGTGVEGAPPPPRSRRAI